MKHVVLMFAAFGLLFACTPENNNGGGGQNNPEELTTTSEALEVTDFSALLTGYANLPFELGEAEVGIMYDKVQSFAGAKKVAATKKKRGRPSKAELAARAAGAPSPESRTTAIPAAPGAVAIAATGERWQPSFPDACSPVKTRFMKHPARRRQTKGQ